MSFAWIVLLALGLVFFLALDVTAAALFTPFILTIDSGKRQMRIRWLGSLEYWRPLPGTEGEPGLSIAGMSIRFRERRTRQAGGEAAASRRAAPKPRNDYRRMGRFVRGCLREPSIRVGLVKNLARLWRGIVQSISFTHRQIELSLPDPAWNGMLAGWLAQTSAGRRAIRVNFVGGSSVLLEARLYPYRVAEAFVFFLGRLPYRALLRQWRASALVPG
jgi:hypothetical protein